MSDFLKELHLTSEFCHELDAFTKHIPLEWIKEAVNQTGKASVRKRRFPAEQAV